MINPFVYYTSTFLFAIAGLSAVLSFLSQEHKDAFLASDADGFFPILVGTVLFAAGLGVDRLYDVGFMVGLFNPLLSYIFKGVAVMNFTLGALILLPDWITNMVLHPISGGFFVAIAAWAYADGTYSSGAPFVYKTHALVLVAGVALATLFSVLSAFGFASKKFKGRLSQNDGGWLMLCAGAAIMALAPIGSMVIIAAALGALVAAFGLLIALPKDPMEVLLSKGVAVASIALMFLAVFLTGTIF